MPTILPAAAYILLWWIFRRAGSEWRRGTIQAMVLWSVLLIAITELLSLGSLVTRGWLTAAWAGICLLEIAWLVTRSSAQSSPAPESGELSRGTRILLLLAGILVASTGILALIAPPNTWDAMEYHLPRVMMWVSNHNVRHFPTPDYAQLVFGPATEYEIMHLYLLWGGDRLINLVNFFCFVGAALAASLIAQRLGAGLRGQVFAALFVITIPEALLEASGAMNTAGIAFWIVTAAYFVLAANQEEGWTSTVLAGLSVGMAVLTKGTAYIYLPFVLLACWWVGSRASRIRMLQRLPVLAVLVLALNAAQYARAYDLTGSPLGLPFPDGGPQLHWMSDHITPVSATANVIRNIGLHLETPSGAINARIDDAMRWTIRRMGQDPDDPNSIWPGLPFITNRRSLHEAYAGNPFHFAVLVGVGLLVVFNVRNLGSWQLRWYAAGIVAGFVLFCGLLRWQIWSARHHLPVFALLAPVVGLAVERLFSNRASLIFGTLLLLSCAPFVYMNKLRSFIPWSQVVDIYRPRTDLYFADQHLSWKPDYQVMAKKIRDMDCHDIAVHSYLPVREALIEHTPSSFFVYPLFAMLHVDGANVRVRYVGVHNFSSKYEDSGAPSPPCAIACMDCVGHPQTFPDYPGFHPRLMPIGSNELVTFQAAHKPSG